MLRPMLASPGELPSGESWAFEPKWDGFRMSVSAHEGGVTLRTRSGRDVSRQLPELAKLPKRLRDRRVVLDGEMIHVRPDGVYFYALLSRLTPRTHEGVARAAEAVPVTFMAFDLLWLDDEAVYTLPYRERRARLEDLALSNPRWQTTPVCDDGAALLAVCEEMRLEGVVAKRLNSRYLPGRRSRSWVKAKCPSWRQEHGPLRLPRGFPSAVRNLAGP